MNQPNLAHLNMIPPGLVIVAAPTHETLHVARLVVTREALCGGDHLGVAFPMYQAVVSLHAGPPHHQKRFVAQHGHLNVPDGIKLTIEFVGSHADFNFCGHESAPMLTSMFAAAEKVTPTAFILAQTAGNVGSLRRAETLGHYRRTLMQAGATGVVFLMMDDRSQHEELAQLCDEFIEVQEAEPDADMDAALVFDVHSLHGFSRIQTGQVMCGLRYAEQGIHYRFERFISIGAEDRLIWALRCMDWTLADIGEQFGCNKTTVMRRLMKLPRVVKQTFDQAWLEAMLFQCGVEEREATLTSSSTSSRHDDEDEEDFDEEDFDEA